MTTRVLVAGGAGYLGSILSEHLLRAGYRVTVIDNLMYGQHSLFHLCANDHFEFVFGVVRDETLMGSLIKKADVLIPLAAMLGALACNQNPFLARSVNLEVVKRLNRLRNPDQLCAFLIKSFSVHTVKKQVKLGVNLNGGYDESMLYSGI